MRLKKGMIWDTLLPWIIGIILFFIVLGSYLYITGKLDNTIEYFKTLLRFGR